MKSHEEILKRYIRNNKRRKQSDIGDVEYRSLEVENELIEWILEED